MKKLSLILAMSLTSIAAFAQTHQIYGHVQDGSNQPVSGQVVTASTWNNWNASATTDGSGNYSIDVPDTMSINTYIDIGLFASTCMTQYTDSVLWQQQDFESNFTICPVTPPPTYHVSGQVTANGNGIDAGIVYLIEDVYDVNSQTHILTALDSVYTDTMQGYYWMDLPQTVNGTLKLKAGIIANTPGYADNLPTYYTSSLTWNGTGMTTISNTGNVVANIDLIAGVNPGGPAFVGGDVLQGANKSTAPGDPLEARILILTTAADVAVAYTYSDANGHFEFPSLAYGSYKLFGDVWGKDHPAIEFTLSATTPSLPNVEFQENSESFDGLLWPESVTNVELSDVAVYPNPVSDVLNITGLNKVEGAKTITVTGINGAVVFSSTYGQNDKVSIPVSGLSSGIYMLQINTAKGNAIYKIAK